ncbi:MAG: type II toxin-antitoxin system HigB family toxin [Armatimonadetes bacterium]|nr:type II toxin-antitoxin system HigB family toxin [Armatimonadota bacterium]
MHVISRKALRAFWEVAEYMDAEQPLRSWFYEAEHAEWTCFADVKTQYGSADYVGDGRVVFNIAGNKYRLVVRFAFEARIAFIRFVGTHEQYDGINDISKI